ncbi:MAG: M48 family metalloprotease [Acidobacteriota bacterium]
MTRISRLPRARRLHLACVPVSASLALALSWPSPAVARDGQAPGVIARPELGFTLSVPAGWTIYDAPDTAAALYLTSNPNVVTAIAVRHESAPVEVTEMLSRVLSDLFGDKNRRVIAHQFDVVQHRDALVVDFEEGPTTTRLTVVPRQAGRSHDFFLIMSMAPRSSFTASLDVLSRVAGGFRLTEAGPVTPTTPAGRQATTQASGAALVPAEKVADAPAGRPAPVRANAAAPAAGVPSGGRDLIERALAPSSLADAEAAMVTTRANNRADGLKAYERALVFLQQGATAEASNEFRNAEKKDDKNVAFVYAAAYGYLKTHKPDDALRRYEKFYKNNPADLRALVGMAAAYEERQNYREAVRVWQRYLKTVSSASEREEARRLLAAAQDSFVRWYEIAENPAGGADNLLSPKEELEWGLSIAREFASSGVPVLEDEEVVGYVQQLSQVLVANSKNFPSNYRLFVLDTSDVNAFTIPGFVFVNRGLLAAVDTEAELAGVLAHEIGHSVAHHFGKKRTREYQDQKQLESLKSSNNRLARFFAKLMESGNPMGQMSFSRDAEYQADRLAVHICYDAGIDPLGFSSFFQKLESLDPSTRKSWDLMSRTHPFSIDRLHTIQDYVTLLPSKETRGTSPGFQKMKLRLGGLPPPPDATGQLVVPGDEPPSAPPAGGATTGATQPFTLNNAPFAGEIPAGWGARKTEAGTTIFEGPQGTESYEVSIELGLEPKRANASIDTVGRAVVEVLSGRSGFEVEGPLSDTAGDGTPVRIVKATYSVRTNSGRVVPMRHVTIVLDYPGFYVLWSYFTPDSIFQKYSDAFTMIMERFRYTGG